MTTAWLGIDPGVSFAGLALRLGPELLGWKVVTRKDDESIAAGTRGLRVGPRFIRKILAAAAELIDVGVADGHTVRVAVEWLNAPVGFARDGARRQVKPADLVAVAIVTGAIVGAYPDATLVPPLHAGQGLLVTYPEQLVTPTERRAGLNRKAGESAAVSHAREAWDVAGHAPAEARRAQALADFDAARADASRAAVTDAWKGRR